MYRKLVGVLGVWSLLMVGGVESSWAEPPKQIVKDKAKALHQDHRKARRALLQTARDPVFVEYFSASEADKPFLKRRIEELALHTQSIFNVEEMCLIDRKGHEIARVDKGQASNELAHDEADLPFFEPGFKLPKGSSLVSPIYLSEDAEAWVIAYVAPIYVDGQPQALLHYEHPLEQLQQTLIHGVDAERQFVVAVNQEGWVIADSRQPVTYAALTDKDAPADYFASEVLPGVDARSLIKQLERKQSLPGYQVAIRKIGRWTLLAFEKAADAA